MSPSIVFKAFFNASYGRFLCLLPDLYFLDKGCVNGGQEFL